MVRTALLLALLALGVVGAVRATAVPDCDVTWDGGAGTNVWGTAANWDTNVGHLDAVPTSSDDVCVNDTAPGVEAVLSTGTASIASLQGTGAVQISGGTLDISGSADPIAQLVMSSGTLTGDGTLRIGTSATWSGGAMTGGATAGKTTLDPTATLTLSGNPSLGVGRTFDVGGTFAIAGDFGVFSTGAVGLVHVLSTGVVRKTGGTGSSFINPPIDNDGTVEVTTGTGSFLTLGGGSGAATSTGTFGKAASLGEVRLNASTHTIGPATFAGNVQITGSTVTIPTSTTITANGTNGQSSGTINGDGQLTIPSAATYTWSGGSMLTGTTTVSSNGTVSLTGNPSLGVGRTLELAGLLDITGDFGIFGTGAVGLVHVASTGVVRKTGGTGSSFINPPIDNDGTVEVTTGTGSFLTLGGGSGAATSTGTFGKAASLGEVRLNASTHTIGPATFAGNVQITGSTVTIPTSTTITANGTNGQSSGTINGDGQLTIPSAATYTWSGGSMLTGTTTVSSNGTVSLTGNPSLGVGRTLELAGLLDITGDFGIFGTGAVGLVHVASTGVVRKTGGTGSSFINPPIDNDGTVEVTTGTGSFLTLGGGSGAATSTGTFGKAASLGEVRLNASTHTIGPATFAGNVQITGSTVTIPTSTTITANGTNGQSSGTINGTGALTVTGTFTWSGGTMGGAGTTTVSDGATLVVSDGVSLSTGRQLEVTGLLDMQGDRTIFRSGAPEPQIHVAATGIVRKTSGAGTGGIDVALRNQGLVDSQAGRLELRRGTGSPHTGTFSGASESAPVAFDLGTHTLGAGTVLSGAVEVGGATVEIPTGVTLAIPGTLVLSSGTLGGAGTLSVTGTLHWTGGTQAGPGTTTVGAAGHVAIDGGCDVFLDAGRQVINAGTISLRGTRSLSAFGTDLPTIENSGRLEFDVSSPASCGTDGIFGDVRLHNTGTIERLGGPGSTAIDGPLDNDGTLVVTTGDLALSSTADVTQDGSFTAAAGATVTFAGGTTVLGPGATVTGSVAVTGARLELADGSTLTIPAGNTFTQSGGTIAGGGTLRVLGTLVWSDGEQAEGTTVLEPGATATLGGDQFSFLSLDGSRAFVNRAALTMATGEIFVDSGASILNEGTLELEGAAALEGPGFFGFGFDGALLDNTGTLRKTGAPGEISRVNVPLDNGGTVEVTGGTLVVAATLLNVSDDPIVDGDTSLTGGTFAARNGTLELRTPLDVNAAHLVVEGANGAVTYRDFEGEPVHDALATLHRNAGNGELELAGGRALSVTGPFANAGILRIGAGSTLSVGGAFQQSGGTLRARIAGTAPAKLQVAGSAALGGRLAVETEPGFTPANGAIIPLVTSGARTGTFDAVTGLEPGGSFKYALDYDATQAKLTVQPTARPDAAVPDDLPAPAAAPEPVADPKPVRLDDRALAIGRGRWTRVPGYSVATRPGATLVARDVTARSLALSAFTCRTCGTVEVVWRGRVIRRVSLRSRRSGRRVLRIASFTTPQHGTVRLRAASSGRVAIDALVVA